MEGKNMHSMSNIKRKDQAGLSLERPCALRLSLEQRCLISDKM